MRHANLWSIIQISSRIRAYSLRPPAAARLTTPLPLCYQLQLGDWRRGRRLPRRRESDTPGQPGGSAAPCRPVSAPPRQPDTASSCRTVHPQQHSHAASGQRLVSNRPSPYHLHPSKPITLAHVNINSITAPDRLDELETFADTHDIDIMCLTETKLGNAVSSPLYYMDGFSQPLTKHRDRHGGGVAIYAKNNLAVTRLIDLELDAIEWIWAKVRTSGHKFIVCCVYFRYETVRIDPPDY